MRIVKLTLLLSLLAVDSIFAQTILSNGTGGGDWNTSSTWVGGVIPDFSNSTQIRIQSGDVVTIPSGYSVQVDQLQVRTGAQLLINTGGLLDVVNASGNDMFLYTGTPNAQLVVNGTIETSQGAAIVNFDGVTATVTNASTVTVNSGGVYRHKHTTSNGTILGALWQPGSTVEVVGFTTNASRPFNLTQSFHHFVWNCPNQTSIIDLRGNLSTVNGDLSILSTGGVETGKLRFFYSDSNQTLTVGGNLTISGQSGVWFTGTGLNNSLIIGGDFTINTSVAQTLARSSSFTVSCGDFNILNAASTTYFGVLSGSGTTLNLFGDLNLVGSLNSGMGTAAINFVGSAPTVQNISGNGSMGKTAFTIASGAIVDVGTNSIRGTGSLVVNNNAELRVGSLHASGAVQNSTTNGNVLVPVSSRIYGPQATLVYNGAGAQVMNVGHPQVNTVIRSNVSLATALSINNISFESGVFTANNRQLTVNGNWNVNGGTFNPGTAAVVFASNGSINGTGPFQFNVLTINSGVTVTLPNSTVSLSGNLNVNGGSIIAGSGTLTLNGASTQTITSNNSTLNNLTVNKAGGEVNLGNSLSIRGILSLQSASTFRTYGFLTLLSTNDKPAVDGSISQVSSGASIVGDVLVQRYIGIADNYHRFISSPISNATVAQVQDDFPITGDFPATSFPCTGCNNNGSSFRSYNETIPGALSTGYEQVPAIGGATTQQLMVGAGYSLYMWNGVAPVVWDVKGTVNIGPVNFTVSHTTSSPVQPSSDGWNLVGNPYPSAIQWNNGPGWIRSNIDPTVWVWDVVGRVWHSYNSNTSSGDLVNGIIAMGEAFWVYCPTPGAASLSINEAAKSSAGNGTYYRSQSQMQPIAEIELRSAGFSDKVTITAIEGSTNSYDPGLDAPKPNIGIERLRIAIKEQEWSLGSYALPREHVENMALEVNGELDGKYTLVFSSFTKSFLDDNYYLIDKKLNQSVLLKPGFSYTFDYSSSDPIDRFYLSSVPLADEIGNDQYLVEIYPNPTTGLLNIQLNSGVIRKILITESRGQQMGEVLLETNEQSNLVEINLSNYSEGLYILKIVTDEGVVLKKVYKL